MPGHGLLPRPLTGIGMQLADLKVKHLLGEVELSHGAGIGLTGIFEAGGRGKSLQALLFSGGEGTAHHGPFFGDGRKATAQPEFFFGDVVSTGISRKRQRCSHRHGQDEKRRRRPKGSRNPENPHTEKYGIN